MSATIDSVAPRAQQVYAATTTTRAEILVDALERCITGRPLPESLTPPAAITRPPVGPISEWI
jgi:hypothetical protein